MRILALGGVIVLTGAGLAVMAPGAQASTAASTVRTSAAAPAKNISYVIYDGSVKRGFFEWNGDPYNGEPGDAFRVKDDVKDGYGVEIDLRTSPLRVATTAGHNATYTTPWNTGNLPENHDYTLDAYTVKNGKLKWIRSWTVTS